MNSNAVLLNVLFFRQDASQFVWELQKASAFSCCHFLGVLEHREEEKAEDAIINNSGGGGGKLCFPGLVAATELAMILC